jgi:hypothetical protein
MLQSGCLLRLSDRAFVHAPQEPDLAGVVQIVRCSTGDEFRHGECTASGPFVQARRIQLCRRLQQLPVPFAQECHIRRRLRRQGEL